MLKFNVDFCTSLIVEESERLVLKSTAKFNRAIEKESYGKSNRNEMNNNV